MTGTSKQLMRIVLIALLFQFVSPVFLPIVMQGGGPAKGDGTALHAHHSSIIVPQLLKEKDETEFNSDLGYIVDFIPLIDFSDHSFVLTQLHESKFTPFGFHERIDYHPPLFTLHSAFLI